MTFARSPVIPNTTKTSAFPPLPCAAPAERVAVAVISSSLRVVRSSSFGICRHGDSAGALVGQSGAGPVDDRLGAVLVRGQEREVHGAPGELGLLALHRLAAEHLHDRCAATDRRHRPLVAVLERFGLLAGDAPGNGLAR